MTFSYSLICVLIIAAVTALLRFLPFLIFRGDQKLPKIIVYLGNVLSYAIMGMLVVYCLKGLNFSSAEGFLPAMISSVLVILLYLWKKNTLLSIVSGTVSYMLLLKFLPGLL